MTDRDVIEHDIGIEEQPDGYRRRICSCGYRGAACRGYVVAGHPCPRDQTITALVTLQMHWGGLLDSRPADGYAVHLVRSRAGGGTPGPTLCGIDRFAEDAPGWSVGGGISGPRVTHRPCSGCVEVALRELPGLRVSGLGAKEIAAAIGAEATPWGVR